MPAKTDDKKAFVNFDDTDLGMLCIVAIVLCTALLGIVAYLILGDAAAAFPWEGLFAFGGVGIAAVGPIAVAKLKIKETGGGGAA